MPGNIAKDGPTAQIQQTDLVTPTLKSDHYTTGRGGTGNMARNDPNHPEIARAAQDVDTPVHREDDAPHFYGRGGAGNLPVKTIEAERKSGEAKRVEGTNGKGFVEKIKEKLGGKK